LSRLHFSPKRILETVLNFSKKFSGLDVFIFVCALGEFLVLSASVLRQIARYLPHHTSENDSKTHPKSSHDKFKTISKKLRQSKIETTGSEAEQN